MKINSLMAGFVIALMAISVLSMGSFAQTRAENTISYSDPSGDVENDGFTGGPDDDVDIVSLSLDQSSDPIIIELTVSGLIDYNNSEYYFDYLISLNQDENNDPEVDITINPYISGVSVDDMGGFFDFPFSGQGTDTLHIELTKAQIGADVSPVIDITAYTSVARLSSPFGTIEDWVNDNFGEGTPADDDDDDDDDDYDGDGDQMPDSWEQLHGLDTSINDADDDHDGDGYSNYEEYVWGTAPDDINSYPDFGFDDDDDDDTNDNPDPKAETPTDDSITVTINNVEYNLEMGDDTFEMEQKIDGTTNGTVHHCSITMVTYYDDGTYEADDWQVGPDIEARKTILGITSEMYFKGTGPGGNNDWSEWAWYMYTKAAMSWYDDFMDDDGDNTTDDDGPEITKIYIVVRAYSDASETNWNQDSKDITEEIMDFWGGDQSGDGDKKSPGLGIPLLIGSIAVIALIGIFRRKRE